jgi:hypothetical protein
MAVLYSAAIIGNQYNAGYKMELADQRKDAGPSPARFCPRATPATGSLSLSESCNTVFI